jgi:hypothetical protein
MFIFGANIAMVKAPRLRLRSEGEDLVIRDNITMRQRILL